MKIIYYLITAIGFLSASFLAFLFLIAGSDGQETKTYVLSVFGPASFLLVTGLLLLFISKAKRLNSKT
jgi:preprotein translocase subunit SecY